MRGRAAHTHEISDGTTARKVLPMKKSTTAKKAVPKKKPAAAKPAARAPRKTPSATGKQPLVAKQPSSKQQDAVEHGIFLHTDDSWSTPYFDANDLHFLERELFG
jgi:hypothetical protein